MQQPASFTPYLGCTSISDVWAWGKTAAPALWFIGRMLLNGVMPTVSLRFNAESKHERNLERDPRHPGPGSCDKLYYFILQSSQWGSKGISHVLRFMLLLNLTNPLNEKLIEQKYDLQGSGTRFHTCGASLAYHQTDQRTWISRILDPATLSLRTRFG
ncbi:hypothetical protein N7G274_004387 [Stereocaulon virgatum]|uniref:Uncharacterized protein n=1 Tax=Stereocaulon virgatum TaxID=373712 RepID=A0ABR4AA91_9LECA